MGLFKNRNNHNANAAKSALLFEEIVRETNEVYEDLRSEYEAIENVVAEFKEFADQINGNLSAEHKVKFQEFIMRLNQVNHYTQKSVRDVSDLLRSQKKILNEIKREN